MAENKIPKEIQEILNRCRKAQIERKKKQQEYCINKYYENKNKKD